MTRRIDKLPTPLGVGSGQTATVDLPIGMRYERINIRLNNNAVDIAAADWVTWIDEIRLIVDGDVMIAITAEDLVKMNQFYGQTLIDGVLPLFLSLPWMRTLDGEDQTAYETRGMRSFSLEIDLKAGLINPALSAYAIKSEPKGVWGTHLRIRRYVHNQGVTGEAEISDFKRGAYAMLALHVNTDDISSFEIVADNRKIIEVDTAINEANGAVVGRVDQTGMTHVDFVGENRLGEAMPMALQDFRFKPMFTASGNFSIYAVSVEHKDNV